jgi:hypothetical protein
MPRKKKAAAPEPAVGFCCLPLARRQPPGEGRRLHAAPAAFVSPLPRPQPGPDPAVPAADDTVVVDQRGAPAGGGGTPGKGHCSVCGSPGVTKASHVVGHAKAALHDFTVVLPKPPPPKPRPLTPPPTPPPAPLLPPSPRPRVAGGRVPVHLEIEGGCSFDAYDFASCVRRYPERACLKSVLNELMRDMAVGKRKAELVALAEGAGDGLGAPAQDCYLRKLRLTTARLERREEAMRVAAAAAGKAVKDVVTEVDHRVEVQLLTHGMLQTAELHATLRHVEWSEGERGKLVVPSLSRQKQSGMAGQTVESALLPVYQLHNGSLAGSPLFNLQLVDAQINKQKKAPFKTFIEAHVCGTARDEAPAEHLRTLLVKKATGPFFEDAEGAQRYADALFADVRTTCDAYGPKLRDVAARPALLSCYGALGDTMAALAEEFERVEPRLDR